MSNLLIIIAGPTASGKTQLAIDLALHFNTVIISADSRQFFKELTIGTAKPSTEDLSKVRHYFINSHSISQNVNAGTYAEEVFPLLKKLFIDHKIVIMTGGSGLYIDAVISGMDELPAADKDLRSRLDMIEKEGGIQALQEMLKEKDPASLHAIDFRNPRRIKRALEVSIVSGKPYSSFLGKKNNDLDFDFLLAGIDWPRNELYDRINHRVVQMIADGLYEEVAGLLPFREMNALKTVGYKEMFEHIDGTISLETATGKIAQNTRNYAKRQLTWFRKYNDMIWLKPGEENKLVQVVDDRLKQLSDRSSH